MTEARPQPPVAVDVPDERRVVLTSEGSSARLDYRVEGDRMVLVHTEVPEALAHRGIGGQLVRVAVERAVRDGLTLVPWCPFARGWLREHPEVASGADIDWNGRPTP